MLDIKDGAMFLRVVGKANKNQLKLMKRIINEEMKKDRHPENLQKQTQVKRR